MKSFGNTVTSMVFSEDINRLMAKADFDQSVRDRLKRIKKAWDFYEGYHWEDIASGDKPEITVNYIRSFVNKFVAFELGEGFSFNVYGDDEDTLGEKIYVTTQGRDKTLYQFLEDIWIENKRIQFCTLLGQTKSVTGDAWVKIIFISAEELDDPFGEFPSGKIHISVTPTHYVFPSYDQHDIDKLERIEVKYLINEVETAGILRKERSVEKLYTEEWTREKVKYYKDNDLYEEIDNPYGIIPFVQIKNFPLAGQESGANDIDDLIPLNVEYNLKKADISEIIDYHAAPITVVYGAKIGNLEKGANKVWGGIPKDARVQNLDTISDLSASNNFINNLKTDMCEVGAIPETVLGGAHAISNTSGVALQYMNMPLIDRTKIKRALTQSGIQTINKIIIHIALKEGLIFKPDDIDNVDFYYTDVVIPDTLPKDTLLELQVITMRLSNQLISRKRALERLGEENIDALIAEIDREMQTNPLIYGIKPEEINSGMGNGESPQEILNLALNGANVSSPPYI